MTALSILNTKGRGEKIALLSLVRDMDMGGLQTHIRVLSRQLIQNGHKVIALTGGGSLVRDLEREGVEHQFLSFNFNVYRLNKLKINPQTLSPEFNLLNLMNLVFLPFSLLRAVRISLTNKINIIHAHTTLCILIGLITSKLLGIPFVVTLHHFRGLSLQLSFLLKKADRIIAVSHEIKEKIVKAGFNPDAVIVIPNMIDINNLATSEVAIPQLQQNSFKIVTVSRLDSMKTEVAQSLIFCAERLIQGHPKNSIQVVIVGDGTEFDKIRKMADEVNHKLGFQSIILTGYRKDAIRIIAMADIVVGAGRVVLEAMAIGKPIIVASSRIHGILTKATLPQIAKYNFSGRNSSEQTNSENTYQFITKLIQDKPFRESTAEFSHEIIKKNYSTRAVVNRIQEVYKQLLG